MLNGLQDLTMSNNGELNNATLTEAGSFQSALRQIAGSSNSWPDSRIDRIIRDVFFYIYISLPLASAVGPLVRVAEA